MKQKAIFLESEGDRWFERNRDARAGVTVDPVQDLIDHIGIAPKSVLEIGCGSGWRLAELREKYGCAVLGVEPSREACIEAASRMVPAIQCTASSLAVSPTFDLLIYGFCLYLTDPEDWLRIAAEGDAVLAPGGHLIIHDFYAWSNPTARRYEHCDGVLAYHYNFADLWLAHPIYSVVRRSMVDGDQVITVLKKGHVNTIRVL